MKYLFQSACITTMALLLSSCSPKNTIKSDEAYTSEQDPRFTKATYLAFIDGAYIEANFDKEPVPILGKEQFSMAIYKDLRYPADAREKGIQGSVLFEVLISDLGHVQKISQVQGIGYGCDEVAMEAIRRSCMDGFEPGIIDGKPVFTKYLVPVNFRLH